MDVTEAEACPCGHPDDEHCNDCWRCPGDPHDDRCGWDEEPW